MSAASGHALPRSKKRRSTAASRSSSASSASAPASPPHPPVLPSPAAPPTVVRRISVALLSDGSLRYNGAVWLRSPDTVHPLLAALEPVRTAFHFFLHDEDAARLLRVGRSTALALLAGFTFRSHVFDFEPRGVAHMRRTKALYETYDMRPTRLCLPPKTMPVDLVGVSPFPSSLSALLFAPVSSITYDSVRQRPARSVFDEQEPGLDCPWSELQRRLPFADAEEEEREYARVLGQDESTCVQPLTRQPVRETVCFALPPGLLPHGLRRLSISVAVGTPLQAGSLPSSLRVLHTDAPFLRRQGDNREPLPLCIGALPASLVHVVLDDFEFPLTPGQLPPSLERLRMDAWDQPLDVGVLPASLKALYLRQFRQPLLPDVLPAGLTHLALACFTHEVAEGVLPPSLFSLDLGPRSHQSIVRACVLPASLRVLWWHTAGERPLVPGLLPEGLQVLHWKHSGPAMELLPGQLPSGLLLLDLDECHIAQVTPHSIPGSVRHLLLSGRFRKEDLAPLALPQHVQVHFSPPWI